MELTAPAKAAIVAFAGVLGLCIGSFLNCAAWRAVRGEKVSRGRSRCPTCGHTLGALELIPLASYVAQRGRCRSCGGRISPRYPAAELVCAAAYVMCVLRFGLSFEALRAAMFASVLLCCAITDIDAGVIPDRFHAAGAICWVATLPLVAGERAGGLLEDSLRLARTGLLGGVCIAGGLLLLSLLMDRILGRESMGGGDVKMFFTTGLYLGAAMNLLCVIASCVTGVLYGAVLLRVRRKSGDSAFPLAPAIAVSAFAVLLAGNLERHLALAFGA